MLNHRISNELNQYTTIDTFTPQYDADGNQTLIKTSTGIWSVTYNAENRPVRWESGDTVVTMDFDRMGRRVFYKEEVNGVVTKHHRFVYDNYLCVQKVDALNNNSQINLFVWDPTEPVATRPLFTQRGTGYKFFYTCDGNKNVSEMVHFETRNGIAAHYDYAPFGAVTRAISASAVTDNTFTFDNPFRFSSEYHDDTLGLVYYNYRHYNPIDGRWNERDSLEELRILNLYQMKECLNSWDLLGQDLASPWAGHKTMTKSSVSSCYKKLEQFEKWYEENRNLDWTKDLIPCPSKMNAIEKNGEIVECKNPDPEIWEQDNFSFSFTQWWGKYHPGGVYELRTKKTTRSGNQCIYDACCKLMTQIPSAGTADRSSPNGKTGSHQKDDVSPFEWARILDDCFPNTTPTYVSRYYERRPPIY